MLATLYELQEAVEETLFNLLPASVEEFVTLTEQRIDLDAIILAAGGKSGIVLNY